MCYVQLCFLLQVEDVQVRYIGQEIAYRCECVFLSIADSPVMSMVSAQCTPVYLQSLVTLKTSKWLNKYEASTLKLKEVSGSDYEVRQLLQISFMICAGGLYLFLEGGGSVRANTQ